MCLLSGINCTSHLGLYRALCRCLSSVSAHFTYQHITEVQHDLFIPFFLLGIISLCYSQSCENEGERAQNRCGESCLCINGRVQNCCRVRKHFTSMSLYERRLYVTTVLRASTTPQYRQLISIHKILFRTGIHQKDQFLPWHRW